MERIASRELTPDELAANIEAMGSGGTPPYIQDLGRITCMGPGLSPGRIWVPIAKARPTQTTGTHLSGNPRPEIPRNKR